MKRIDEFCRRHADAAGHALAWLAEARSAEWRTPEDIRSRFPKASFVGTHVIFDLRGNRYRLDVRIAYATQIVSIIRVGTHAEYNRWTFSD